MKERRNYSLSKEALLLLAEMAKKEGRSQANMLEQLIIRAGKVLKNEKNIQRG